MAVDKDTMEVIRKLGFESLDEVFTRIEGEETPQVRMKAVATAIQSMCGDSARAAWVIASMLIDSVAVYTESQEDYLRVIGVCQAMIKRESELLWAPWWEKN